MNGTNLIRRFVEIEPLPGVGQRVPDELHPRRGKLEAALDDESHVGDAAQRCLPLVVFAVEQLLFGVGPHRQLLRQMRRLGRVHQLGVEIKITREIQTFFEFAAGDQPFEPIVAQFNLIKLYFCRVVVRIVNWLPVNWPTFRHTSNAKSGNVTIGIAGTFDEDDVVLTAVRCQQIAKVRHLDSVLGADTCANDFV